jgi:hypothetical protein
VQGEKSLERTSVICGPVLYGDAETTAAAIYCAPFSKLHRSTSAKLAHRNDQFRWYELMVHQIVDVNEFQELFDMYTYVLYAHGNIDI